MVCAIAPFARWPAVPQRLLTLTRRSNVLEASDATSADELGRKSVLDVTETRATEASDVVPGADPKRKATIPFAAVCSLSQRDAKKLYGDEDHKLTKLLPNLQSLLNDGFKPIIFCRFIQTAEYVATGCAPSSKGGGHLHHQPAPAEGRPPDQKLWAATATVPAFSSAPIASVKASTSGKVRRRGSLRSLVESDPVTSNAMVAWTASGQTNEKKESAS